MGAVDIGVRHDDDLVIAQLGDIEVVTDAGAEGSDQRADLRRGQHLVEARALDVEDLAAQRQDRLELAVAALLCGAAGAVALDDEDLGFGRIALLAVGELAGQRGDVERALAAGELTRLAGGLARGGGFGDLGNDLLGLARMLLEPLAELGVDEGLDRRPDFGGHQLVLGLRREFWVGHLDREHAC